eukprot:3554605-Pyramimonas_sp.AAC.1
MVPDRHLVSISSGSLLKTCSPKSATSNGGFLILCCTRVRLQCLLRDLSEIPPLSFAPTIERVPDGGRARAGAPSADPAPATPGRTWRARRRA